MTIVPSSGVTRPSSVISSNHHNTLQMVQHSGIVTWQIISCESASALTKERATTVCRLLALTHPNMFSYVKSQVAKCYFHHMVCSDQLIM